MSLVSVDLDALANDLAAGSWTPTTTERAVAAEIAALPQLSCLGIRAALGPARTTRSRLVVSYERVAGVLNLPPVHEEEAGRSRLIEQARTLAAQIAAPYGQ